MVILHVKKGDESLFLYETNTKASVAELLKDLVTIFNGKLRIERLCYEIDQLSKHGVYLPPKMQGLSPEQIVDLKLKDDWSEQNLKSFEHVLNPDVMGNRTGLAPTQKFADILTKTTAEATARISKKMIESQTCLSLTQIQDTLDILHGATCIAYPMGIPVYDPVYQDLIGTRDLSGTQASKDALDISSTDIWWANKQLETHKTLGDFIGKNEKSKLIVKLQKKGYGAPAREPAVTEEQRKELMLREFHRREELKKLEEDETDSHLDSEWADSNSMKRNIMGMKNIKFK